MSMALTSAYEMHKNLLPLIISEVIIFYDGNIPLVFSFKRSDHNLRFFPPFDRKITLKLYLRSHCIVLVDTTWRSLKEELSPLNNNARDVRILHVCKQIKPQKNVC
jgi:hypothetical protein